MPGLVGIAQATGARDLETSISRAIGALRYGSSQQSEKVIDPDGRWAIGCVDLGLGDSRVIPYRHPATGTWAVFSGRLHLDPSERSAVSEKPADRPLHSVTRARYAGAVPREVASARLSLDFRESF